MRLRIYRLDHRHAPCMEFESRSNKDLGASVRNLGYNRNSYVYCAVHLGKVVGIYAVDVNNRHRSLSSNGTIVIPSYQKCGVASKLWTRAIKDFKPVAVSVSVISDRGNTLVCKMRDKFPRIDWEVQSQIDCRGPKDLRQGKAA